MEREGNTNKHACNVDYYPIYVDPIAPKIQLHQFAVKPSNRRKARLTVLKISLDFKLEKISDTLLTAQEVYVKLKREMELDCTLTKFFCRACFVKLWKLSEGNRYTPFTLEFKAALNST